MAQISGAKHVVEIGTFTGYSALVMAKALPQDGKILTIEHNPQYGPSSMVSTMGCTSPHSHLENE
jgi:caffeoyl-CoA O-methyltransferase